MNTENRFVVLLSILIVLALLAACGAPESTETMVPTPEPTETIVPTAEPTAGPTDTPPAPAEASPQIIVTFAGDECVYEGPEKVPAGRISVVLDVEDQEDHEEYGLAVLTLDEGKTFEDLDAWSSTDQPPWADLHGLLEEIPQGSRAEMTAIAIEGPLFLVCFTAYPITKSDTLGPIEIDSTEAATPEEELPEAVPTGGSEPQQEASLDELEGWDLVYITDNAGNGAQYYLPAYIEEDTGKTVTLHGYVIAELSAQAVLEALRGETANEEFSKDLQGLKGAVAEAEMIVFFAGNYDDIEGMAGLTGELMDCFSYQACNLPNNCTLELYQPYTAVVGQVFEEIFALREGKPTIIRALDFYNPYVSGQGKCGAEMQAACSQCWTAFNGAIRLAAETHNVPLVSVYDLFNGVEHNQDPNDKGYLGNSGFFPSTDGSKAIAKRISEEGYEPVIP